MICILFNDSIIQHTIFSAFTFFFFYFFYNVMMKSIRLHVNRIESIWYLPFLSIFHHEKIYLFSFGTNVYLALLITFLKQKLLITSKYFNIFITSPLILNLLISFSKEMAHVYYFSL